MNNNCLVVGFGSIGARHARILTDLGFVVHVVSNRKIQGFAHHSDIPAALGSAAFDYAVICQPTSFHYQAALELKKNNFQGRLLIEKPLFEKGDYPSLFPLAPYVGYNLRFHPIIKKIVELIQGVPLYSMHVYCGQYLPQWREGRDYRETYSSSIKHGGGVLRDLSHELDYICHLTGKWEEIAAWGGKVSDLEIDSEDLFGFLIKTEKCPLISLQINYLDLRAGRQIVLNGEGLSLKADLVSGLIEFNNEVIEYSVARDQTYIDQHKDILSDGPEFACTYEQGLDILELIEASQRAAEKKIWITKV